MSIARKRTDNPDQLNLFDLVRQQHEERSSLEPQSGTMNVTLQLQEIVDKCIGRCPLSRELIAGRMSDLTGTSITRMMLDSWTASAKHKHRFPAEFLPAFCIAVGSDEPITFLARRAGLFTMQDRDVLRADLARQMEIRETAAKKMRQIKSFLEQID